MKTPIEEQGLTEAWLDVFGRAPSGSEARRVLGPFAGLATDVCARAAQHLDGRVSPSARYLPAYIQTVFTLLGQKQESSQPEAERRNLLQLLYNEGEGKTTATRCDGETNDGSAQRYCQSDTVPTATHSSPIQGQCLTAKWRS